MNDGGQAFPLDVHPQNAHLATMGMSLREYFFASAVQGLLASGKFLEENEDGKAELSLYEYEDDNGKTRFGLCVLDEANRVVTQMLKEVEDRRKILQQNQEAV